MAFIFNKEERKCTWKTAFTMHLSGNRCFRGGKAQWTSANEWHVSYLIRTTDPQTPRETEQIPQSLKANVFFFLSARKLLVFVNQNFSEHIINKHERTVLHLCLHSVSSSTYRPVCILSFLSTAETDVLVPALSQSTDGVVVSFVVALKFPNVTIRTTKTVESVQLNGAVVILKFPNISGAPRAARGAARGRSPIAKEMW